MIQSTRYSWYRLYSAGSILYSVQGAWVPVHYTGISQGTKYVPRNILYRVQYTNCTLCEVYILYKELSISLLQGRVQLKATVKMKKYTCLYQYTNYTSTQVDKYKSISLLIIDVLDLQGSTIKLIVKWLKITLKIEKPKV